MGQSVCPHCGAVGTDGHPEHCPHYGDAYVSRECAWCNEIVPTLNDGRLAVHAWDVGWDRERDVPIKARCVGAHTTVADAVEAQR